MLTVEALWRLLFASDDVEMLLVEIDCKYKS